MVNEGIQADTVRAGVLAVGRNAQAIKNVADRSAWDAALAQFFEFERAMQVCVPAGPARDVLESDIGDLKRAIESKKPEQLTTTVSHINGKLKMIGIVLKDVAALAEPITAICSVLQIPLKLLGL